MQTSVSLTSPMQETFRVLGLRSNLASVEVLGQALGSPFEQIRLAALQTLINRGGESEMSVILERIDQCNEAELPLLVNQVSLLRSPIEAGLADRDPLKRQRSLCAIAKLHIAPQFHHLVQAAQSPEDTQQTVAAELILGLATDFGKEVRHGKRRVDDANREQLLSDLWQSILQFNDHRILLVIDAWLCALHWNDRPFKELFKESHTNPIYHVVLRQLKNSHRSQITELLAGVLWSHGPVAGAVTALGERTEQAVAIQLAELVLAFGVTPNVTKNLRTKVPFRCLGLFNFSDNANSIRHRCALIQLYSALDISPDKILHSIIQLLETKNPAVDLPCSNGLRGMRSLKTEIVVMVLSDCFETPGMEQYEPPPWKSSLRSSLERLIELYPHQAPVVRSSIQFVFSDFRCEELIKHLDNWPESHLNAYAKIVRIAEVGFVEFIERDAKSQSAVKRIRAINAVRFLGMDNGLIDVTLEALEDKNEKVRVEAIYAIASGNNWRGAIDIIRPLLGDAEQSVKTAADFALSRLES